MSWGLAIKLIMTRRISFLINEVLFYIIEIAQIHSHGHLFDSEMLSSDALSTNTVHLYPINFKAFRGLNPCLFWHKLLNVKTVAII